MKKLMARVLILSMLFSLLPIISPTEVQAQTNTVIRTTLSRSYYDYWRYSSPDKAGWYKGYSSEGGAEDVRIGDSPTYSFYHSYYRSLNPGEKVKSVRVKAGTISTITQADFEDSKYQDYNGINWSTFFNEEYLYIDRNASVSIPSGQTFSGLTPSVKIIVSPKLLSEELAKNVTYLATKPTGTTEGFRTYVTFIVEWEIELPQKPKVTLQHFNLQTGERLEPDTTYQVEPNTQITVKAKSFPNSQYVKRVISYNGGVSFTLLTTEEESEIIITKDTIIRDYHIPIGELIADLEINANPSAIEKGKTATVQFTLNAGGSRGTYPITKYEFWFGDSSDFKSSYDYSTSNNAWVTSRSGVKPKSTWYGKVKVYDTQGNTDVATAQVTIGEIEPDKPVEVRAVLWITSDDPKVIEKDRGWIKVKLPYKTIKNNEKYDLDVKLDGSYSSSTNGISNYHFNLYNEGWEEDSSSPVIFQNIELYPYQSGIGGSLTVTDSTSGKTDTAYDSLDIYYVAERVPPGVELTINKNKFFYGETALLTPKFIEDGEGTFPIHKKEYEIKKTDGTVKLSGEGEIPRNVLLEWENGTYKAIQRIYYLDDDSIENTAEASVTFEVKTPISTPVIKAYMLNDNLGNWIDVTNNNNSKVYKRIKLDISDSVGATDPEVQAVYPIQFNNDKTQIQIIPITAAGEFDSERNSKIYTYNQYDKTNVDGRITFKGKQAQEVRIDAPGKYKIRAKVYNGFMDSDWATAYMEVRPDLPPIITAFQIDGANYDPDKEIHLDYREPDNQLKTTFTINVDYAPQDDDIPDPASAKLEVRYDFNNDNDASNDGEYSAMYVKKDTTNLKGLATVTKSADMKNFNFTVDNPEKNILGRFRFEYSIGETPTIPNFTGGDLPGIPENRGDSSLFGNEKKLLYIDNRKAIIRIEIGKKQKFETYIIDLTDGISSIDPKILRDQYGDDVKIYIIDGNELIRYE